LRLVREATTVREAAVVHEATVVREAATVKGEGDFGHLKIKAVKVNFESEYLVVL